MIWPRLTKRKRKYKTGLWWVLFGIKTTRKPRSRRKASRRKKKDQNDDVYVMKRVTNVSSWAYVTFQREYKIGVSNNTKRRNKRVDKAIKGDIVIVSSRTIQNAYCIEDKLHKLFGGSRFRIKGGKGGGVTEWFYLNPWEYGVLELWLTYYEYRTQLRLLLLLVITLFLTWLNIILYL